MTSNWMKNWTYWILFSLNESVRKIKKPNTASYRSFKFKPWRNPIRNLVKLESQKLYIRIYLVKDMCIMTFVQRIRWNERWCVFWIIFAKLWNDFQNYLGFVWCCRDAKRWHRTKLVWIYQCCVYFSSI